MLMPIVSLNKAVPVVANFQEIRHSFYIFLLLKKGIISSRAFNLITSCLTEEYLGPYPSFVMQVLY